MPNANHAASEEEQLHRLVLSQAAVPLLVASEGSYTQVRSQTGEVLANFCALSCRDTCNSAMSCLERPLQRWEREDPEQIKADLPTPISKRDWQAGGGQRYQVDTSGIGYWLGWAAWKCLGSDRPAMCRAEREHLTIRDRRPGSLGSLWKRSGTCKLRDWSTREIELVNPWVECRLGRSKSLGRQVRGR